MNNFNDDQEKIYEVWKQSQTEVSKETSKKSLSAFQEGLKDAEREHKKRRKIHRPRRRLPGIIGGTVVAALILFLIVNTGIMDTEEESASEEQERVIGEEVEEEPQDEIVIEGIQPEELLEKALNRPSYDYETLNRKQSIAIFNSKLQGSIPRDWKVFETKESNDTYIQMSDENNEKMTMAIFEEQDVEEIMNTRINELTNQFGATEDISISIETLIDKMNIERNYRSYYEATFPFDLDKMELKVFYNEENKQVMELYVTKLFGYPIVFTSEFNIEKEDSWNNSIIFFTTMRPTENKLDIHGSDGELHPMHGRPIEKEVQLLVGASGLEQVEVELYENDELGLTSYLTKTTEVQRIEHADFVEWRFTEPEVAEGSFISFGKLKDGFMIEKAVDTMFSAHGIDTSLYTPSEPGAPLSNFYAYHDNFMDGNFHLFEVDGEWYYKHYHGEFDVYNGGTYSQRLDLFMDSIEWY